MKLTEGEKMIWAGVFSAVCLEDTHYADIQYAAKRACLTVEAFRHIEPLDKPQHTAMLSDMRARDPETPVDKKAAVNEPRNYVGALAEALYKSEPKIYMQSFLENGRLTLACYTEPKEFLVNKGSVYCFNLNEDEALRPPSYTEPWPVKELVEMIKAGLGLKT